MEFFLNWECFLRGLRFAEVRLPAIGNKGRCCVLCIFTCLKFFARGGGIRGTSAMEEICCNPV